MNFKRIAMNVEVGPLMESLEMNSDLFGAIDYRRSEGSPHIEMRDIWLRYNDIKPYEKSGDFTTFNDEHDAIWYDCSKRLPQAMTPVFNIMRKVHGTRLGMVLITKLPSGGKIYPHFDKGWHASYYDKYYVPIKNGIGSSFYFEDGVIDSPQPGSVWWFDNSVTHWVNNDSDEDRIAMIVCIKNGGDVCL